LLFVLRCRLGKRKRFAANKSRSEDAGLRMSGNGFIPRLLLPPFLNATFNRKSVHDGIHHVARDGSAVPLGGESNSFRFL